MDGYFWRKVMKPEKSIKIAVFASGSGTNAEAIIRHFRHHPKIEVALVVTNKPDAGVIHRAERLNVEWMYLPAQDFNDSELVLSVLEEFDISYIVLAGWLLLVPPYLVHAYEGKILNIHPALLPKFGGKGMYGKHVHRAVKRAGETESGITIHLVNEEFDKGEILAQFKTRLDEWDDENEIERKVRELEIKHYPPAIEKYILGRVAEQRV
ncbi:MAG: phosphoribosylglycinamide formyltransferase [Salibacteraceae bacterium]